MSLAIIKSPQTFVNGHLSKWQAVHQPIIFDVQRQDQAVKIKYFLKATEKVSLVLNGAVPSEVIVGDSIQYYSPSGNVYLWTVLSINGVNIDTDGTITGNEFGGFINYVSSRKNFFIETEVFYIDLSSTLVSLGTLRHKIDSEGKASISINKWLKTRAKFQNEFNYDQINKAIDGEGGKYSIKFKEVFLRSGESDEIITETGIYYWVNSSKQVQEVYGTNVGEHVPTLDAARTEKAKFLSVFEKPTYFVGFPFSLSFLYSDNLLKKQITREEERFDINGVSLSTSSDNLSISERFYNNRMLISQGYDSSVKEVDVWLESGADVGGTVVEEGDYTTGDAFEPWLEQEYPVKPVISKR